MQFRTDKSRSDRKQALESVLSDWRSRNSGEKQGDSLSETARDRILRGVHAEVRTRRTPFADLFMPARRLALAGIVPALTLAAALGFLVQPQPGVHSFDMGQGRLHATKIGGEVIFVLANGNRSHNVYKSTAPNRFAADPAYVTEDGSFSDQLESGPALVFYRID